MEDKDIIICRCQEVSRQEILDAIADGALTVDGVKRRTRRRAWASVREKPVSVWWQESLRSRQDGPWRRSCRPRAESRYAR